MNSAGEVSQSALTFPNGFYTWNAPLECWEPGTDDPILTPKCSHHLQLLGEEFQVSVQLMAWPNSFPFQKENLYVPYEYRTVH